MKLSSTQPEGRGGSLSRCWAHGPSEGADDVIIRLVGPGGAGKTTTGVALGERLGIRFADLDEEFTARFGDISAYLAAHGYHAYAAQNIAVYLDTVRSARRDTVIALSSGFLTYRDDTHQAYRRVRREIATSRSTIVVLPSLDYEACVAETVRRQLCRPFSRSAEREEAVIRARFTVYRSMPRKKVETHRPVDTVVDDLVAYLSSARARAAGCGATGIRRSR